MKIKKFTVTPEDEAQARRDSLRRAGVSVTVSDALLKRAEQQSRKLRGSGETSAV